MATIRDIAKEAGIYYLGASVGDVENALIYIAGKNVNVEVLKNG